MITPHGSVSIRQAQESDAPAYRALRLEALRNHPEAFSSDYARNEGQPMNYWVDRLRTLGDDGMFYFTFHDEDLVGMCGIYRGDSSKTKHSATIISVYVQAEWRGYGIAEGLIEGCLDWARAHEVSLVKLAVVTTNMAAIRCYARCGFRTYGIEPQAIQYDGKDYDEMLMARQV